MKALLVTLLPVVAALVLTRIFFRPARQGESAPQDEHVVRLRMPRSRVYTAMFFTFFMFPFGLCLLATRPFPDALVAVAALSPIFVGGGLWVWAVAARQFFLSREGIEIRGFRGVSFEWADLKEVQAYGHGSVQEVRFVAKEGRLVALDSTMEGWHGLVRALREFGTEHTKPMFDRALREIGPDRVSRVV